MRARVSLTKVTDGPTGDVCLRLLVAGRTIGPEVVQLVQLGHNFGPVGQHAHRLGDAAATPVKIDKAQADFTRAQGARDGVGGGSAAALLQGHA